MERIFNQYLVMMGATCLHEGSNLFHDPNSSAVGFRRVHRKIAGSVLVTRGFLSFAGLAIETSLFIVYVSLLAILHSKQVSRQTHPEFAR